LERQPAAQAGDGDDKKVTDWLVIGINKSA
jgi:hypothetical protein